MRVAIMGCGAMGSVYAAMFYEAGHEVVGIVRNSGHRAAIARDGLHVSGASGDRFVPLRVVASPPNEKMDLVVIAVKAAQAGAAARAAWPMIGPGTVVLTIQNGLGAANDVAAEIDPDRLAVGVAGGFGAALFEPGRVHHNGMSLIRIGAHAGLPRAEVETLAALWTAAGFRAETAANIAVMQWEKLICNVAYSALCALTGLTVGEVMDDPNAGPVSRAAATEAWVVAKAAGVSLSVVDPVEHVRAFGARIPNAIPSVAQDVHAGRSSEIDTINGAVPRTAERIGMQAPVNATLTHLVKFAERLRG